MCICTHSINPYILLYKRDYKKVPTEDIFGNLPRLYIAVFAGANTVFSSSYSRPRIYRNMKANLSLARQIKRFQPINLLKGHSIIFFNLCFHYLLINRTLSKIHMAQHHKVLNALAVLQLIIKRKLSTCG